MPRCLSETSRSALAKLRQPQCSLTTTSPNRVTKSGCQSLAFLMFSSISAG